MKLIQVLAKFSVGGNIESQAKIGPIFDETVIKCIETGSVRQTVREHELKSRVALNGCRRFFDQLEIEDPLVGFEFGDNDIGGIFRFNTGNHYSIRMLEAPINRSLLHHNILPIGITFVDQKVLLRVMLLPSRGDVYLEVG